MDNSIEVKIDNIRITMAENFGVTKTELVNIKEHLVNLNGQTAKNVEKIENLSLKVNIQDGLIKNSSTWRSWLLPTLTALLTGLSVYIITH